MKRSIFEMSEFISKLTAFDLLLFFTLNTHTHLEKTMEGHHFFRIYKSDTNLQKEWGFLAGQFLI